MLQPGDLVRVRPGGYHARQADYTRAIFRVLQAHSVDWYSETRSEVEWVKGPVAGSPSLPYYFRTAELIPLECNEKERRPK